MSISQHAYHFFAKHFLLDQAAFYNYELQDNYAMISRYFETKVTYVLFWF